MPDSAALLASVNATKTLSPSAVRTSIRVRSYTPRDYPSIIEIFNAGMMMNATTESHSIAFWEGYVARSLTEDLADIHASYFAPGGHFWVAVADTTDDGREEVVGLVGLENKGDGHGELRRMSVKKEFRRFGVGRLLLGALEHWALEHAIQRVFLWVAYVIQGAHAFYQTNGYTLFRDEVYHAERPRIVLAFYEKALLLRDKLSTAA